MSSRIRIRLVVIVGIAAVLTLLAWNHYRHGPPDYPVQGRIVIAEPDNIAANGDACEGAGELSPLAEGVSITITPSQSEPVLAMLEAGSITPEGYCEIAFAATVPDAMIYRFRINQLPELTRDHYLIDEKANDGQMILAPILRWDYPPPPSIDED